ncbi:MAG: AMP-binding protein [Rhodobacteraceae bacterium]|nr:AMP-binding protein [Paracoccaceae bacterium]
MWRDNDQNNLRRECLFGDRLVWCFADRPASFHAMLSDVAERFPDSEALVAGGLRLSYRTLWERAGCLASRLVAHGVVAGDRVAILIGNRPEFVEAVLACVRLGAIATPLNTRMAAPEIAYCVEDCSAAALLHQPDAVDLPLPSEIPSCLTRLEIDGNERPLIRAPIVPMATPHEEEPVFILYTSGTTGRPKGAVLTGVNIVHTIMHYCAAMRLNHYERSLLAVPGSHVTGLIAQIAVMFAKGGAIVMQEHFKAGQTLELLATERITHTIMVPAMYNLLLREEGLSSVNLSTWRIGGYGGAPMPQATIRALADIAPSLGLVNAYGATETTSPATLLPPEHAASHSDSIGWPLHCVDIVVMDGDGREVPAGEIGELWIAGPMTSPGYWDNSEATAANFVGGYWKSGDLGSKDMNGFVRIVDRKKDMINRGGYKVYSVEVENALALYSDVQECAVVGYPCPVLGERVKAIVTPTLHADRSGLQDRLADHVASHLSDYKRPDRYVIVEEPLPRNPNGKVRKTFLR